MSRSSLQLMVADFSVIAITPSYPRADEEGWIMHLLETHRADRVHIRHPQLDREGMAQLLSKIRPDLLSRISIHDHHDLAGNFDGVGVHFNGRNPRREVRCTGLRSAGVHNVEELEIATGLDYILASPVFDSLSKVGYKANADIDALVSKASIPVVALGGVTPSVFDNLRSRGYAGAAMLGYFRCKESGGLQFITNGSTVAETVEQAAAVLEGGCRWVQVRMKDADSDSARQAVLAVAKLAAAYGARVIVDDRVELAAYSGVAGVHLGLGDMDPAEARRILGPAKIIGMTVNTPDRIAEAVSAPVDYYGVGPYRFTTTKKRLAPVLGSEGVANIVSQLKEAHPDRGIVVIGGVTVNDISDILSIGADGIAVSGTLIGTDASRHTRSIIDKFEKIKY